MGIEAAIIGSAIAGVGAAAMDSRSQRKSVESMEDQRNRSQEFIERSMKQARGDLFKLFPEAQESRQQGLQAGIDVLKQSVPIQAQAFQGGNMAAQKALLGGQGGIEAAFLGQPYQSSQDPYRFNLSNVDFQMPQAPQFAPISPNQGIQGQQIDPQLLAWMQAMGGQNGY